MSDPQGPVPGALDHHHPYTFIPHHHNPTTSKHYQNGLPDLNNHHITLLKNSPIPSPWNLPPSSDQDNHPRLSDTFSEMRYLELNNWDLNSYSDGLTARLVDTRSTDSNDTPINYRPWEKPDSSTNPPPPPQTPNNNHTEKENGVTSTNSPENKSPPTLTPLQNAFPTFTTEPFPTPAQKLPSFQSQFNAFNESQQPPQLDTPPSLPSFHTLPATRYVTPHQPPTTLPMVTTPVLTHHHREPQPFLEDRHIQLFPGQVQMHNPHHHHTHLNHHPQFPTIITQNGTHHQPTYQIQMNGSNHYTQVIPSTSAPPTTTTGTATLQLQELVPVPPMHTLLHPINVTRTLNNGELPSLNLNIIENTHFTPQPPQPQPHQNGTIKYDQPPQIIAVKLYEQKPQQNGHSTQNNTPQPHQPAQKPPPPPTPPKQKGKRKRQENGHDPRTPHQVSSVSSTEPGYKRPSLTVNGTHKHVNGNGHGHTNGHEDNGLDKPVKKKRKRCGECTGCQRKDNCGECAPCRNDKSHQICKMRRCDMLTEKKTPKSKLKNQQNQNTLQPQHL